MIILNKSSLLLLTFSLITYFLIKPVNSLSKYCSSVNRVEILSNFKNCCSPFVNSNKSSTFANDSNENYNQILRMLENVFKAIETGENNKNETKHLILEIIKMVELANRSPQMKICFTHVCSLFKNCEFPISIEYKNFEHDAAVAPRMASLLTALTINEANQKKNFLTKENLVTFLKISIVESPNIYDIKIIFKYNNGRLALQATKNSDTKIVEVGNFKQILEESKNFQWYFKWVNDNSKLKMKKLAYTQNNLDNFEAPDVYAIYPTSLDFNNTRYISDITYDCLKGVWNRIVSVPFIYPDGEIRGVVAVSISLNNFDLVQCGGGETSSNTITNNNTDKESEEDLQKRERLERDPFYDTDKCDRKSTICVNEKGKGFVLDSYNCECKPGYYKEKKTKNSSKTYSCLKCSDGCEKCEDNKPCRTEVSENYRRAALIINLICIFICIILVFLLWYHMAQKMLKTSSPKMLFMVLLGAIISYCEIIPMYFTPNYWTCTAVQILQLEGFLLAYGALVLKTWRECKLFYVRSVKTIKITDKSLMKRLGLIMLGGTIYLAAWTLRRVDSPKEETKQDSYNLKYETCTVTEWNFGSMAIQLAILFWGVVLSVQVRRASIAFKETKLITWAIFNECVVACFVISINVLFKYTKVSCYVPFFLSFIRIHLTITVMLLLLFSYKVYTIIVARKKPFQANQSSGMLNNFSVSGKDSDQKSNTINDETDKERELKIEIQRLYRQIEEMRSLSMRIANPHLLTKKSRFISYPTKKSKLSKSKNALASESELSKVITPEPEMQSLMDTKNNKKTDKLKPIEEDSCKTKIKK